MLTKKPKEIITYKAIIIYEQVYQLPVLKTTRLKTVQKKIRERRRLIKEGIRYRHKYWGIIKRPEEISQGESFTEIQLLIKDYIYLIDLLESYKNNYQNFLLKLTEELKDIFTQKYLEIKQLEEERKKLVIKNNENLLILEELQGERRENIKTVLLLSNAYFLMLEKIKLIDEGVKKLAEDTKQQKQIVQQIAKDLDIYQEVYEYQKKAQKVRQGIAKIAKTATVFDNSLQENFSPLQNLIDETVKLEEDFSATVEEIKNLAQNSLKYESNLVTLEESVTVSKNFLNLLVASYEKKERLKDAFFQSQLIDWEARNFEVSDEKISLDQAVELVSNYINNQVFDEIQPGEIASKSFGVETTELVQLTDDVTSPKEFQSRRIIDYSLLQNLLAQRQWKAADIETAKLMLQVMGKSYWNEVYKEDILNFSCQALQTIDELWKQYSHGYFGFSVQQNIWNDIGGHIDYETEKRLGDRLGWRKDGRWLEYDQLTFKLASTTPIGHLPVKWLHYDQDIFDLSPNYYIEPLSMGAWRVGSWLVWQMHLFFTRTKICNS